MVVYCDVYKCDINDFVFSKDSCGETLRPDIQSQKYDVGIEHTSTAPRGERKIIGESVNLDKNDRALNGKNALIDDLEAEYPTADIKRKIEIDNTLISEHCKRNKILDKIVYVGPSGEAVAPKTIIAKVKDKTHKLNNGYKIFGTNALFINISSFSCASNSIPMCGETTECDVKLCLKCDNCTNCPKYSEGNCFDDDCKIHKICDVGAVVRALQKTQIEGEIKFNPIILFQNEEGNAFKVWIINTESYTVNEILRGY